MVCDAPEGRTWVLVYEFGISARPFSFVCRVSYLKLSVTDVEPIMDVSFCIGHFCTPRTSSILHLYATNNLKCVLTMAKCSKLLLLLLHLTIVRTR